MKIKAMNNNLQKIRKGKKISVADLSVKVGVTRERIYQIERGTSQPSFALLVKLADVLGVTANDILHENSEPVSICCPFCGDVVVIGNGASGHIAVVCSKCKRMLSVNLNTNTASVRKEQS